MTHELDATTWYLKKLARRGMAASAWTLLRASAHVKRPRPRHVRAITYHRIGDRWPRDPFCVGIREFAAHMQWLAGHELAISLDQATAYAAGRASAPEGAVLVTLDDGWQSVYTQALPILRHYRIPAVVYVSSGLIGNDDAGRGALEPFMTWAEVHALAAAGVTIGSHAHTHRSMGRMSMHEARAEALLSKRIIEDEIGTPITSFAYPFGTPTHYDEETTAMLREAGYESWFLATHGFIRPGMDLPLLPRVKIEGGEAQWMFQHACQGAMDAWAIVDHLVSRVRAASEVLARLPGVAWRSQPRSRSARRFDVD